jgi:hypothetical protein
MQDLLLLLLWYLCHKSAFQEEEEEEEEQEEGCTIMCLLSAVCLPERKKNAGNFVFRLLLLGAC